MFNDLEKLSGNGAALRAIKKAQAGNGSLTMAEHAIAGNRSIALATRLAEVGDYSMCMGRHIRLGKNSVGIVLGQNQMPLVIVTSSKRPIMTYEAYLRYSEEVGFTKDTTETIIPNIEQYLNHQDFINIGNE